MEKLTSEGKCVFCEQMLSQSTINRHLKKHLNEQMPIEEGKSYLIYAKAAEMFLCLWVDSNTTFAELDDFLRDIWLECCGHLSAFFDKTRKYNFQADEGYEEGLEEEDSMSPVYDMSPNQVPFHYTMDKIWERLDKLTYYYDFGSTTRFELVLQGTFSIPAQQPILLLSRNEPLKILCSTCNKKPAKSICSVHIWDNDGFYCVECAKKHKKSCEDFADYAKMPVVNSPRMGVCAYEGGQIDKKRDGVYKETE